MSLRPSGRVQVGRVTGHPEISEEPISIVTDADTGRTVTMKHFLQRKVSWGPFVLKDKLPSRVQNALRAQQSISNLNDHWESIYHSIYHVFINGNNFHFSINVKTEAEISNYAIAQIFNFLSEAEFASKAASFGEDFDLIEFNKLFISTALDEELLLRVKANFMSPGDVWGKLIADNSQWVAFYMIYSAFFGSDLLGWDGILDIETRQYISQFIIEKTQNSNLPDIIDSLKLEEPKSDTSVLEDATNDAPDIEDI